MSLKLCLAITLSLMASYVAEAQQVWTPDNVDGTFTNPIMWGDWPDPDVVRVDDKFYVGFCTPKGWGNKEGHFSICIADKVEGPWERTIFPEYLYDPGLFFDDDGKVYVVHGQHKLFITELNADVKSVKGKPVQIWEKGFKDSRTWGPNFGMEGSHMYKINGMYYITCPAGGTEGWQVCLRSKNICGPYEHKVIVEDATSYPPNGLHQGGMVQLENGDWWFIIMQDRGPIGRVPHLLPADNLKVARNTLTQRVQGPSSEGSVELDLTGLKDGNVAGLGIFQLPYAYVAVVQEGMQRKIVMSNQDKVVESVDLNQADKIRFRARVMDKNFTARFYYSLDGKTYYPIGDELKMGLGFPWTGNRFALFNFTTKEGGQGGYADFNWFHFTNK